MWYKRGDPEAPRLRRKQGTGHIDKDGYLIIGKKLEHRSVMEIIIGRPLLPIEQVHHINGVKLDNRPNNLELWAVSQPPGQRVVDLVTWARYIEQQYGLLVDSNVLPPTTSKE